MSLEIEQWAQQPNLNLDQKRYQSRHQTALEQFDTNISKLFIIYPPYLYYCV
jgi:hypothetical protein